MDQPAWDQFIQQQQGSFLQSWHWGEFQAAYGRTVIRLQLDHLAAQLLVYPLKGKHTYLFSPYGPTGQVTDTAPWLEKIKAVAQQHQAVFWRYEQLGRQLGGKCVLAVHPSETWVLTLDHPATMLLNLKPKWRYNIHLAERKGVTITTSTSLVTVPALYALLQDTAQRQQINLHPLAYYQLMVKQLGEVGMLKLYLANYEGKIIAGNFMIYFGNTATYLHGGSNHAYRAIMAPHLLQWQAMVDAYQAGYHTYDFFGMAPTKQPNHPWAGITRFKQGFGGNAITYPGTYELPLQKMWYTAYSLAKLVYGYSHRRRG